MLAILRVNDDDASLNLIIDKCRSPVAFKEFVEFARSAIERSDLDDFLYEVFRSGAKIADLPIQSQQQFHAAVALYRKTLLEMYAKHIDVNYLLDLLVDLNEANVFEMLVNPVATRVFELINHKAPEEKRQILHMTDDRIDTPAAQFIEKIIIAKTQHAVAAASGEMYVPPAPDTNEFDWPAN